MNDVKLTLQKQTHLFRYLGANKFSRAAFQAFKQPGVNHNTYAPKMGLTLGQFFTYDVAAKTR